MQVAPADMPPGCGEDSAEAPAQQKRCAQQPAATYILLVCQTTFNNLSMHAAGRGVQGSWWGVTCVMNECTCHGSLHALCCILRSAQPGSRLMLHVV